MPLDLQRHPAQGGEVNSMGLGDVLGNIGVALAGKPKYARTPNFIGPTVPMKPQPSSAQPIDTGDDQSYDYTQDYGAPPSSAPNDDYQSTEKALQSRMSHPPVAPNTYKRDESGNKVLDSGGKPILMEGSQKIGLGRKIGGALLMGAAPFAGPMAGIPMSLGARVAYGDYPEQLQRYGADINNLTAAQKAAIAAREEQRKIEQNQNATAESKARREDLTKTREANAANQAATQTLAGQKAAGEMLGSGEGKLYQAPPPVTANVPPPSGVSGLAPTQATVPSPPKPPDVQNIGGMDIRLGEKPKEYKTAEEAAMAVLGDATLHPEVVKQKLDAIAKAHNVLHPQTPIHSFQDDDNGNVTMLVVDPANPAAVKQVPLGKIGKTKTQPDGERKDLAAGLKAYTPALDSAQRMNIMTKNYEDAVKHHDQQAMLSLLANHLGMTMGLQKGARLNQAIIAEAEKSRPWLQGMVAKFDSDGYLSGLTLTPAQMQQMVNLGRESFAESMVKARSEAEYQNIHEGPKRVPGTATMNFYLGQTGGDVSRAKAMAAADGWSVQ